MTFGIYERNSIPGEDPNETKSLPRPLPSPNSPKEVTSAPASTGKITHDPLSPSYERPPIIHHSTGLGSISALHQVQAGLVDSMHDPVIIRRGMRDYACGSLWDM